MRTRSLALTVALLLGASATLAGAPPAHAAGGGFVNIADALAFEGDTAVTPAFFLLQRVESYDAPCTIDVFLGNGTAGWGSDYYPQGAHLTFAPGQQYAVYTVWVLPDEVQEPVLEVFFARILAADGCGIGDQNAAGWIVDDDAPAAR